MPILEHRGAALHWDATGQGTPVLLLHGLGSSSADWGFQVQALAARHRVVTLDVRGHGQSSRPEGPYTIGQFAGDALAVLDAAQVPAAHVVGLSMGGMVALELALAAPDRVRGLVIVNSGPAVRPEGIRQRLLIWRRRALVRFGSFPALGRTIGNRLFPKPGQEALREQFLASWARNERRAYVHSFHAILGWTTLDRMREVRQPTLVVSGDRDYTPTSSKRRWAALLPDARVVEVADSGHATPIDQPGAFNRLVLDFLAEVDARR